MMKRHDDSQRSDRRAVTQPMHAPPPNWEVKMTLKEP